MSCLTILPERVMSIGKGYNTTPVISQDKNDQFHIIFISDGKYNYVQTHSGVGSKNNLDIELSI